MDDEKQLGGVHLGKKVQRLKEKRRLKEKLSQTAHTISEVKR